MTTSNYLQCCKDYYHSEYSDTVVKAWKSIQELNVKIEGLVAYALLGGLNKFTDPRRNNEEIQHNYM
jgi:hypothetical protein